MTSIILRQFLAIQIILVFCVYYKAYPQRVSPIVSINENELKSNLKRDADIVIKIADNYFTKENYIESLVHYNKALRICKEANDKRKTAEIYKKTGVIYSNINDYQNSLKHLLNALNLYQEIRDSLETANVRVDLAALYLKIDDFNKAIDNLIQAKNVFSTDTIMNIKELGNVYMLLGVSYGSKENTDTAIHFFEKAHTTFSHSNNMIQSAGVLNNLGAIHSKLGKNEIALSYYHKAMELFDRAKIDRGLGVTINNIAFIKKKEKKYAEALKLYLKSIEHLKKANSLHYLNEAYYQLSLIYEHIGNYKEAMNYNRLAVQINDSIKNSDVLSNMANFETQYKIRIKEQEMHLIEQEKEIIQKEGEIKSFRQNVIISGLAILVLIGGLVIRTYRISLKNTQLKQDVAEKGRNQMELELKNIKISQEIIEHEKNRIALELNFKKKELENIALRIIEKNQLLEKLKAEVESIDSKNENLNKIKEISSSIKHNLYLDKDRKELELQINQIHQDFLNKLVTQFPNLTKSERRLCSLIVLDIASKDIAIIMNNTPESIKKSRYRLRKKLGLSTEENITDFLKAI